MAEAKALLPDTIQLVNNIETAVQNTDAIVLLTEWNQYRGLNLGNIRSAMQGNVFVDLRNVYERDLVQRHGFVYTCVGR